jgi:Lrp/AsnC family transcriptional regulator for asnA, asnC and gidA
LDSLDRQILALLGTASPISYVDIAARLGTSEATVRRRIRLLIDEGVIEFVAVINPEKIGLHTQAVIGVNVDPAKVIDVADALSQLTQVKYLAYVTGRYALILTAYFTSEHALFHFLTDTLPNYPGVQGIETLRILKTVKRSWRFRRDDTEEAFQKVTAEEQNEEPHRNSHERNSTQ